MRDKLAIKLMEKLDKKYNMNCFNKYGSYTCTNNLPTFARQFITMLIRLNSDNITK